MSESKLQSRVIERAKRRGWDYIAHAGRGIAAFTRTGEPIFVTQMAKGWPDVFMMRTRDKRVLVMELKKETEEPTEEQVNWLYAMNLCGIPAIVVKPSDLREGRVNSVLK